MLRRVQTAALVALVGCSATTPPAKPTPPAAAPAPAKVEVADAPEPYRWLPMWHGGGCRVIPTYGLGGMRLGQRHGPGLISLPVTEAEPPTP